MRSIQSRWCAREEASPVGAGLGGDSCNKRTICKYIHLQGARSCQLVMGVTHLSLGSKLEYDAPPHVAHAALGDLHVLQRGGRCARGPPDGTAGRDAASVAGQPRRGGIAGMVDSCGVWARGRTALRGAWAARTRTMRIWIRHRCRRCDKAGIREQGLGIRKRGLLAASF